MRAKSLQSGEKGFPSGFLTFAERRDVPYVGGGDVNIITIPNVSHGFFTSPFTASDALRSVLVYIRSVDAHRTRCRPPSNIEK
jgi:hypothetical protein